LQIQNIFFIDFENEKKKEENAARLILVNFVFKEKK
jgi:hypothetical protein